MSSIHAIIGALIATYFVSRALLRALRGLGGWSRLLAAHGASLAVLMLATGFLKNYYELFAFGETLVYIAPQLLWLLLDAARGKALRVA